MYILVLLLCISYSYPKASGNGWANSKKLMDKVGHLSNVLSKHDLEVPIVSYQRYLVFQDYLLRSYRLFFSCIPLGHLWHDGQSSPLNSLEYH